MINYTTWLLFHSNDLSCYHRNLSSSSLPEFLFHHLFITSLIILYLLPLSSFHLSLSFNFHPISNLPSLHPARINLNPELSSISLIFLLTWHEEPISHLPLTAALCRPHIPSLRSVTSYMTNRRRYTPSSCHETNGSWQSTSANMTEGIEEFTSCFAPWLLVSCLCVGCREPWFLGCFIDFWRTVYRSWGLLWTLKLGRILVNFQKVSGTLTER